MRNEALLGKIAYWRQRKACKLHISCASLKAEKPKLQHYQIPRVLHLKYIHTKRRAGACTMLRPSPEDMVLSRQENFFKINYSCK